MKKLKWILITSLFLSLMACGWIEGGIATQSSSTLTLPPGKVKETVEPIPTLIGTFATLVSTPPLAPTESWTGPAEANIWSFTSDGMYGGSISQLAISPDFVNDRTIFAACGPDVLLSSGIFRSTDGGITWSWVLSDIPMPVVEIELSPNYASDQTIFVITEMFGGNPSGVILKSVDGGINWEYIRLDSSSGTDSFGTLSGIAFSPDYVNDQTVFVGDHIGNLFKSTDAGVSWQFINRPDTLPLKLTISPDFTEDRILFAAHGGVLKSTDGGESWTISRGAWSRGIKLLVISPNFAADSTVFAGTYDDGVYKTTDAGSTWVQVNEGLPYGPGLHDGDIRALVVSPDFARDSTIFAVTDGEGVYKSIDGGTSWQSIENPAKDIYDLALSPKYPNEKTIYLGTHEGVYQSNDNGASWNLLINGITAVNVEELEVSPDFDNDGTVFAGTWRGLFKSLDGGISWGLNGFDGRTVDIELSPNFKSDRMLFALVEDSLFKSTDTGESWSLVATDLIGKLAISPNYPIDSTIFVYSEGGGVFKSIDNGNSWNAVNNGLTSLEISALAISPSYLNDQTLVAGTFMSESDGGVFRSRDGGNSWTKLSVATDYNPMVSLIAFSPDYALDQTLFISQSFLSNFLHKSEDGGDTWRKVHSNIRVNNIVFSTNYSTDKTLFVGTGDRGIFVSTDGGATWATMNPGLTNLYAGSGDLAITPTFPPTLFAASTGVWQFTIIDDIDQLENP